MNDKCKLRCYFVNRGNEIFGIECDALGLLISDLEAVRPLIRKKFYTHFHKFIDKALAVTQSNMTDVFKETFLCLAYENARLNIKTSRSSMFLSVNRTLVLNVLAALHRKYLSEIKK